MTKDMNPSKADDAEARQLCEDARFVRYVLEGGENRPDCERDGESAVPVEHDERWRLVSAEGRTADPSWVFNPGELRKRGLPRLRRSRV